MKTTFFRKLLSGVAVLAVGISLGLGIVFAMVSLSPGSDTDWNGPNNPVGFRNEVIASFDANWADMQCVSKIPAPAFGVGAVGGGSAGGGGASGGAS